MFFFQPKKKTPLPFPGPLSSCQPCCSTSYTRRTDERLAPVCVLTWTVFLKHTYTYTHVTHFFTVCMYIFFSSFSYRYIHTTVLDTNKKQHTINHVFLDHSLYVLNGHNGDLGGEGVRYGLRKRERIISGHEW